MVYQALARKWRPINFSEIIGQKETVTILQNSLASNKLHHAYLFTGTRGVGKTTIARILAKSLICEHGISANPCNVCDLCRSITNGNCVDVIEIDAASRTKVEDTRIILDNLAYAPSLARSKIYIIDEVHMLSNHSFNALLKSLEEPPIHVKFLLATTDPQKIPITVLSRCLQFKLHPLRSRSIVEQLQKILLKENKLFEYNAILKIATSATGSMRDALSLLERVLAFVEPSEKITLSNVCQVLGVPELEQIISLLRHIVNKDLKQLMPLLATIIEDHSDLFMVLQEMQHLLKNIAILKHYYDPSLKELISNNLIDNDELIEPLLELAKLISEKDLFLYYDIVLNGFKNLAFTPDLAIGFQMIILRIIALQSCYLDLNDHNKHITEISDLMIIKNQNGLSEQKENTVYNINEPDLDHKNLYDVIKNLNISGLTKELAENSLFELDDLEHNKIKLIIDQNQKILITKNNIKNLSEEFSNYFNKKISIQITTMESKEFEKLSKKTIKIQNIQQKKDFLQKDNHLQDLMSTFNVKIEDLEIQKDK